MIVIDTKYIHTREARFLKLNVLSVIEIFYIRFNSIVSLYLGVEEVPVMMIRTWLEHKDSQLGALPDTTESAFSNRAAALVFLN